MTTFEDRFVAYLQRNASEMDDRAATIVRDLCVATLRHHSCLPLDSYDASVVQSLAESGVAGGPDDGAPIVIAGDKLFLERFYHLEREVAAQVIRRNQPMPTSMDVVQRALEAGFPETGGLDRQRLAVFQAAMRQLTIITGGPGTGKTSIVTRLIALLLEDSPDLRISLAAPTGKAAMRLADSIRAASDDAAVRALEVKTLHRLLRVRRDLRGFHHNAENPIIADAVVVDEASMVDLTMMHNLLSALAEDTRLILLGDPNQLPSVDTGNVLADLCATDQGYTQAFSDQAASLVGEVPFSDQPGPLADAICRLDKSYRFPEDSDVGRLAASINRGETQPPTFTSNTVVMHEMNELGVNAAGKTLLEPWADYLALLRDTSADPQALFDAFMQARVLCGHRAGPFGVEDVNRSIEAELERRGLKRVSELHYAGQPVLVTHNDYNLQLFNGDVGICLPATEDGQLVAFPGPDGMRQLLISQLPQHETCFAMTVHKSQGSEFDHVTLILSEREGHQSEELLTRELVYTAVTRTRGSVTVYCEREHWHAILARHSARVSGMTQFFVPRISPIVS